MAEVVRGEQVTVTFHGDRCIHARACVLGLPEVFLANVEGPWIRPDAASPEALEAVAARCPSGAVEVARHAGPAEAPSGRNVVAVWENGPYAARGDLRLGDAAPRTRVTLCRCGASANKPFCDGSHVAAGFQATGEPTPAASLPAWEAPGPLTVTPLKDGPLKVEGAHEVTSGSGHPVRRATTAFLCRCGASANKPFCDGTHRKTGFTAEGS